MEKVVVIGAGSWGTALALVLARNGHEVVLWEYKEEVAKELKKNRENTKFLPGVKFPENITITSESENLLKDVKNVVFSVPSQALRSVIKSFSEQVTEDMILINTAKGIEISSGKRLSEVMKDEILGKFEKNIVVLSGPTHAEEVAKDIPSSIVAAGYQEATEEVQRIFNGKKFRVYTNSDIIGVEIGSAVKNCIAIGAGIVDGLGYGDNTKVALMTRGLAEMVRFGKANGADERTFSGLSGVGDLIVTSISKHSRNRHVGELLGKGMKIEEILDSMTMVAEGVPTIKAVHEQTNKLGVSMPIVELIYKILYEGLDVSDTVAELMSRSLKHEFY